jgi:hypothetical protein
MRDNQHDHCFAQQKGSQPKMLSLHLTHSPISSGVFLLLGKACKSGFARKGTAIRKGTRLYEKFSSTCNKTTIDTHPITSRYGNTISNFYPDEIKREMDNIKLEIVRTLLY